MRVTYNSFNHWLGGNVVQMDRHRPLKEKVCYNENAAKSYCKVLTDKGLKAWTSGEKVYYYN